MAGNTEILIKRSLSTDKPSSLHQGELGYSYSANVLFIGTSDGTGSIEIGGYKDFSGNFINGANTYGDTTHIPVITVAANGLITNVTTSEISTTLSIAGDSGANTLSLITDTLTIAGGEGLTSTVDGNTVTIDVDDTVVRSNTEGAPQLISTDVQISGNLTVQGTTTYVQSTVNQTNDSLIELAANNTVGDVLDIGFYGKHQQGSDTVVTGLVRNAGTSDYYLFDNIVIGDQANLTSNIITQSSLEANGASMYAYQFLASQNEGSAGGFSFSGNEGGRDTGMFSPTDGQLHFYANAEKIITANNGGGLVLQYGANLGDNSSDAIYFGQNAGQTSQGNEAVAIGKNAGSSNQGFKSTAIGSGAGQTDQNSFAVAVGLHAGQTTQGTASVAIGHAAGQTTQGQDAVAVGVAAGENSQGSNATAIGNRAGAGYNTPQGDYAVAVGALAGYNSQAAYSIAINASGNNLNPTEAGLYIDPIRKETVVGGNVIAYNTSTKEVVYSNVVVNDSGITLANGTNITDGESGLFVDSLNYGETSNVVFYNLVTKELTYGSQADLRTDAIANGSFIWSVDGNTGALFSDAGTYISNSANSVVIGQNTDLTNSNANRVAIGNGAGQTSQSYGSVAVGEGAGNSNQNSWSVAVGLNAGNNNQSNSSTAVGHGAGYNYQGSDSVAVGVMAAKNNQGNFSVAVGNRAGYDYQNNYSVAIGNYAASIYQGHGAVAIGDYAGQHYMSTDAIAIGTYAARNSSETNGWAPIAIGRYAGQDNAGSQSVALGNNAGNNGLGYHAIAIGHYAASNGSSDYSIAVGDGSGQNAGVGTVAMGYQAGAYAGNYSVAIGYEAGWDDSTPLGVYQIAIGAYAAQNYGADYSIVLNASGNDLSPQSSGFFVNPVAYTETQDATYDGLMFYNANTKEVRYSYTLDGGSF